MKQTQDNSKGQRKEGRPASNLRTPETVILLYNNHSTLVVKILCVNLARPPYPDIWPNTRLNAAVKLFFSLD